MTLDENSSLRMEVLRFPLIVGVVFIHAYAAEVVVSTGSLGSDQLAGLSTFVRNAISQGVARVAVPLFFMVSGYLFFLSFRFTLECYYKKLKSRFKTLFIPFVFWNIATLLLVLVLQEIAFTKGFFSGVNVPIREFEPYDYVNAVLGIDRSPIAYQFWFIRDLMVMVLLTPVIQIILNRTPFVFLGLLFVLWFFELWPVYMPSSTAFVFFYFGAFCSYYGYSVFRVDAYGNAILLSYFIVLMLDVFSKDHGVNLYFHNLGIILGVASSLYMTKFAIINNRVKSFLLWASGYSFFVFAIHEPLLTTLRKIIFSLLSPNNDVMILILYLSIPTLVICVSLAVYEAGRSLVPRSLSIVTGGR